MTNLETAIAVQILSEENLAMVVLCGAEDFFRSLPEARLKLSNAVQAKAGITDSVRLSEHFPEEEFLNACDKAIETIAWSEVDHAIKTAFDQERPF